jgi:phosphate uptake regulator
MFQKFKQLFTSESLLDSAYTTTLTMLEFDHKMFTAARSVLRESDSAELPFDIRQTDRKINKYEREVRRNVLTHLTIAGTQNLVPGLVLVSIVISVERIGDYTKNIVELAQKHEKMLKGDGHEAQLQEIESTIEKHFPQTIEVLKTQDKKLGREIMRVEEKIGKQSDGIMADMIEASDERLARSTIVCIALYARYLKRINAHLTNIASAIVNPFPRIGFREKPKQMSS